MATVPIACTLTPDAAADRMAEWRTFLSTMVTRVDRVTNQATLTLLRGSDPLLVATDLAEREKACCRFFRFSVEMDGLETRLLVGVPPEAEPILSGLLSLAPSVPDAD